MEMLKFSFKLRPPMKARARQQFELPSGIANIPFAVRICKNIKEKKSILNLRRGKEYK